MPTELPLQIHGHLLLFLLTPALQGQFLSKIFIVMSGVFLITQMLTVPMQSIWLIFSGVHLFSNCTFYRCFSGAAGGVRPGPAGCGPPEKAAAAGGGDRGAVDADCGHGGILVF